MKRLSLAGVAADQAVSVRVGPYVPLTVDLSSESSGRVLYWMVDPNEGTHAEIGVHSGSGQWESFEIRIYSSPMERLDPERREASAEPQRGVPLFRLDHWNGPYPSAPLNGYTRTQEPLRLILGQGIARLEMGPAPRVVARRILTGDRICFSFDEDSALSAVEVRELSSEELHEIEAMAISLSEGFLRFGSD